MLFKIGGALLLKLIIYKVNKLNEIDQTEHICELKIS